jgi:hypothetical protein
MDSMDLMDGSLSLSEVSCVIAARSDALMKIGKRSALLAEILIGERLAEQVTDKVTTFPTMSTIRYCVSLARLVFMPF